MMPTPQAILDTCVLVDILRGRKKNLAEKLRNLDIRRCVITDLTRFELLCGAEESKNPEHNTQIVKELCNQFKTLPCAYGMEYAAKEKVKLKREGRLIPDIDLLIGSISASQEIPLVTGNVKHMERISGIQIIPW